MKVFFFRFHENSANDFRILERSDLQRSKLYTIFKPLSTHCPLLKDETGRVLLPAAAILDVLPSLSYSRSDDLLYDVCIKRLKGEAKEVMFYQKHCPWTHWYELRGRNSDTAPVSLLCED
jgi:hypothetical protein